MMKNVPEEKEKILILFVYLSHCKQEKKIKNNET